MRDQSTSAGVPSRRWAEFFVLPLARFLAASSLRAVLLLLVISLIVFGLNKLIPGDPALDLAGENATPEVIDAIRRELGLDRPWTLQYGTWLGDILTGDLGQSIMYNVPVVDLIIQRLPPTASLALVAILLAVTFGLIGGVAAAHWRGQWPDRVITAISTVGIATPHFWVGLILILSFSIHFNLFPASGYKPLSDGIGPWLRSLLLPGIALSFALGAELQRQTRSSIADVLTQDYIRTARAQGLSRAHVLWVRALRNGSGPVLTVIGFQIGILIGGSIVMEKVFGIPGLGTLTIEAVFAKDLPVIQGVVLVNAALVVVINMLTDLSYRLLNPKVRLQ